MTSPSNGLYQPLRDYPGVEVSSEELKRFKKENPGKVASSNPVTANAKADFEPLDEALGLVLVTCACALAVTPPAATSERIRLAFGSVLRSPGFTDDTVKRTRTFQPSVAEAIVKQLQDAGIVAGNVLARLKKPLPKAGRMLK